MIHSEFMDELSENLHIPKKKVTAYSNALIGLIRKFVDKEEIQVDNFGKFNLDEKKKRIHFVPDEKFYKEINIK
ncbi:MAG: HU family DNA-binding protein [bacterium]|nr:HU family DNA-binding protein [bacterium]